MFCNLGDRLLSPSVFSYKSKQQIQRLTTRMGTECCSLTGLGPCSPRRGRLSGETAPPGCLGARPAPRGLPGKLHPFPRCQTAFVPRLFSIPGDCCNLNDCFNKNSKPSRVSRASLVCLLPQPGRQQDGLGGRAHSAGAEETGPPPSLTAPGPQLQPHVTSNRRITFSRPMTAPLTTLSPGNALPPPAPGALGAFPFRAPCLPSVPDLKTRVPDWAKCFCFQVSPFWALEEGFGVGACRASRVLGTVHRTDEACCCHRPRGIHTSSWEALLQSLRFSVFFNQ